MLEPPIRLERRDAVVVLTLTNPPVNALSLRLIGALDRALDQVETDASVAVLHLRAEGKAFCGGADLAEMRANLGVSGSVDRQIAFVRELQRVLARVEALPLVSLCEIGGAAMGGGLELALAADLRIAADDARLALPEVNLGLIPGAGGTQRLTRVCSPAVAKRLILGAEVIDGCTAEALGVVHWSAPAVQLAERAQGLADRLARLPRGAVAAAKSCIAAALDPSRDGFEEELRDTRRLLLEEPETRRRVEAFLAGKR